MSKLPENAGFWARIAPPQDGWFPPPHIVYVFARRGAFWCVRGFYIWGGRRVESWEVLGSRLQAIDEEHAVLLQLAYPELTQLAEAAPA